MAFNLGGVGALGGAVEDIFGGIGQFAAAGGYQKEAAAYGQAAKIAEQNAQLSAESTRLQQVQADRQIYQTLGGQAADIGAAGLAESGSALDVMRSSASQGALTKQLIGVQGKVNELGYQQEATAYIGMQGSAEGQAAAAKAAGGGGILGGILKGVGAVASIAGMFSDVRLKKNLTLLKRRADGIGIYAFQWLDDEVWYQGVLAHEVQRAHPEAVTPDPVNGFLRVNYDAIGEQMLQLGDR